VLFWHRLFYKHIATMYISIMRK